MANYNVTKDFTYSKVAAAIKADVTKDFLEFLEAKYGTAANIRTKSGTVETNEIAFTAGNVTEDGTTYPAYVTLNPVVKPWKTRPYGKGVREAFNFEAVAKRFTDWVRETAEKAANTKKAKEKKIAADKARREKEKAEAEQEQKNV